MPILENASVSEFLLSESPGDKSRANGLLQGGGPSVGPGMVLARMTANGKITLHNPWATDGSETACAVLIGTDKGGPGDRRIAMVACDAEVKRDLLRWYYNLAPTDIDAALVELAAVGIIARS